MATQPFDPTVLADSLKNLGAASNITEKLKLDWSDISKNLSEQEKNQRRLNVLSNLQSDISATISEQKKASIVYDEASFNLEKRKLDLQQEIYQAQMKRIDEEMTAGRLTRDQLQAAESFKNNLLMQKIALDGTLKVYEKQKNVGSAIDKQFEAVNDEIIKTKKNIDDSNKSFQFTLKYVEKIFEKLSSISEKVFKSLNIPSTVGSSLSKILDIFNQIDTAATNLRQNFGLLPSQGAIFEKNIREASIQLAEFGINAEQLGGTMKQIGSTFTSLQSMEKGLVKDVSIMSAQFGISAKISAEFLQTLGGVSGKSAMAKQNMLGLAKFAANAYGVGLDDVMNDVANASDAARMFAGKNADELVRAAAQARQMGTTLDNMANAAKGLLDFESSIQSELKASALIGKNINFNEARRLAFQGDIIGANKLILDQAKKIKFNQLNPIAQDAFAKAAGKTVKELQEMLNAEENLKEALKSKDPLVRAEAEKKKQMAEMMKKDPIAAKKAAQAEYEKGLIQEKNQTRMKQLQNEINAIFMEFIGPILEGIGPIFTELLKYIKDNRAQIKEFAQEIGKAFLIFKNLEYIALIFKKIDDKITTTKKSIESAKSVFISFKTVATELGTSIFSKFNSIINSIALVIKSTLKWLTTSSSLENLILNISIKISHLSLKISEFAKFVQKSGNGFKTIGEYVGSIGKGVGSLSRGFYDASTIVAEIVEKITNKFSIFTKMVNSVTGIIGSKLTSGFSNAAAIVEKITNKFTIFEKIGNSAAGIGSKITSGFSKVSAIVSEFNRIFNVSGKITGVLGSIKNVLSVPLKMLGGIGKLIGSFSGVSKIFTSFASFGPLFGGVAKFLGPIGIVISVIQAGIAFFKAFSETTGTTSQKAVAGLKAVINVLVIEPLKMVWDFLKKIPSFLANIDFAGILKDVTNFLIDALTSLPDKIEELFSGGGGAIEWGKIFANIARLAIEIIVTAFVKLPIAIYKTVGKLGLLILKAFGLNAIADGIASIADTLYTTLKWPFEAIYNWVMDKLGGKSPSKIGLAIVDGIKSVVDMLLDVLTYPFKKAAQIIPELIDIIKTTYIYAFKSIVDTLFELITYPFRKGFDLVKSIINEVITFIKDIFSGAFTFLVDAFKSDSGAMFDLITNSFRKAFELVKLIVSESGSFIKDVFSLSFDFIIQSLKKVVDVMFDLITYPFKKAFQLIKDAVSEVGSVLKDTFSGAFTFIINALEKVLEKLKGVGGFITDLVGKGFSFVGKILGVTDEPTNESTGKSAKVDEKNKGQGLQTDSIINAIVSSNKAVVEKLDKLTSMMASGQIAVYIDGQRANQLLATSNSKFGSFGQATTN